MWRGTAGPGRGRGQGRGTAGPPFCFSPGGSRRGSFYFALVFVFFCFFNSSSTVKSVHKIWLNNEQLGVAASENVVVVVVVVVNHHHHHHTR